MNGEGRVIAGQILGRSRRMENFIDSFDNQTMAILSKDLCAVRTGGQYRANALTDKIPMQFFEHFLEIWTGRQTCIGVGEKPSSLIGNRPVRWFSNFFTAHVVNHHRVGLKPFNL